MSNHDTIKGFEIAKKMTSVPGPLFFPTREAYVDYDTLSRAPGGYFYGRFSATVEDACNGAAGSSYFPDDTHWRQPIPNYSCDGRPTKLILHAILRG